MSCFSFVTTPALSADVFVDASKDAWAAEAERRCGVDMDMDMDMEERLGSDGARRIGGDIPASACYVHQYN